jgi:hypothetical protein
VSADFALDKTSGVPCPHLGADFRCAIHERLRPAGFPGCAVYDCFGAGQRVTQITFSGRTWRDAPALAPWMFRAFAVVRPLHRLLWYLEEALALVPARPLHAELARARAATAALADAPLEELTALDVGPHRDRVNALLVRVSAFVRAADGPLGPNHRGADLIGKNLRGADLRRSSLRGAQLVGADLRNADLRAADVSGADVRGADLGGADLRDVLFLTEAQLEAASGDAATQLPPSLTRPAHWRGISGK